MPLGWIAGAMAGSALIGGATSLIGSGQAADASNKAANLANERYGTTRSDLAPYNLTGQNALTAGYNLAQLGPTGGGPDFVGAAYSNLPGAMNQAQLEATPGYQFDLSQGLKAVQSAAAARGLGVSGAALKGAGTFATGLANKTYLDQFNVGQQRFGDILNLNTAQQGNLTNTFNRYNALATLGENAGAQTGTTGATLANTAGQYISQGGQQTGAGIMGAGNALTNSANNYLAYKNMSDLINRGSGPGTSNNPIYADTPGQYLPAYGGS